MADNGGLWPGPFITCVPGHTTGFIGAYSPAT